MHWAHDSQAQVLGGEFSSVGIQVEMSQFKLCKGCYGVHGVWGTIGLLGSGQSIG